MGYWAQNTCGGTYFFSNSLASLTKNIFYVLNHFNIIALGNMGAKLPKVLQFRNEADYL